VTGARDRARRFEASGLHVFTTVDKNRAGRRKLVPGSLSAVSEAPTSEELGVETLWRGASDTAT
jgi:hypothetical protein